MAFILATVVGGTVFPFLMGLSHGTTWDKATLEMLPSVWIVMAGAVVTPMWGLYALTVETRWRRHFALAGWVPVTLIVVFVLGLRWRGPIDEALEMIVTVSLTIFVIHLILWLVAGVPPRRGPPR